MSTKKSDSLSNIQSLDELTQYLKNKAINHRSYKYYAKRRYIDSILETHSIYLSNGENWNDKLDSSDFLSAKEYIHYGVCLSFSSSESVAMWMLYSGNDGAMIDYDKETIKSIINADSIQLGEFENGKFNEKLVIHNDKFDIVISDILYYGASKDGKESEYYVKRSDDICKNYPKEIVDHLLLRKKKSSWSYENECRIIISINRSEIESLGIKGEDCRMAKIDFGNERISALKPRVYDSPNYKTDSDFQKSKLADDLNWDLCKGCNTKNK